MINTIVKQWFFFDYVNGVRIRNAFPINKNGQMIIHMDGYDGGDVIIRLTRILSDYYLANSMQRSII